jgi:RNA exonuclease 1
LARVCIIDFATNKLVYDHLVKVLKSEPDYVTRCILELCPFIRLNLTRTSGISAASLEPNTTQLARVQAQIRTIITPLMILLRASLQPDLFALQLAHIHNADTLLIVLHPFVLQLKPGLS